MLDGIDLVRVEVVAASGSALPGDLALAWMDRFGDNLYNIYGSTEVAYATIATPEDLRAAPSSAGKPPHGTVVRIFDEDGRAVAAGETGRIFVGNGLLFEGYTGGGSKDMIDGLMSRGDVGRFDEDGRLLRRGPRRRDDRLRRRERLPQGGRGLPGRATTRWSRRPPSASTTTTSASGCGPSSCARGEVVRGRPARST